MHVVQLKLVLSLLAHVDNMFLEELTVLVAGLHLLVASPFAGWLRPGGLRPDLLIAPTGQVEHLVLENLALGQPGLRAEETGPPRGGLLVNRLLDGAHH